MSNTHYPRNVYIHRSTMTRAAAGVVYYADRFYSPATPTAIAGEYIGRLADVAPPSPGDRVYSGRFSFVIQTDGSARVVHVNPY